MSNDAFTSQAPRTPTPGERRQLADYLLSTGAYDAENALGIANGASVSVYDD